MAEVAGGGVVVAVGVRVEGVRAGEGGFAEVMWRGWCRGMENVGIERVD